VPELDDPRPLDTLGLNFARSKLFADVSLGSFERMGRKLGVSPRLVSNTGKAAAERILALLALGVGETHLDVPTTQVVPRTSRHSTSTIECFSSLTGGRWAASSSSKSAM
jgi:hypothetical protein